jgi:hypothetical protein
MRPIIKAIGLAVSVSALLLTSTQHSQGTISAARLDAAGFVEAQLPYEEINAYYDGAKWVSDGSREVTIIKPISKPIGESGSTIRLTSFQKSAPMQKTELTLRQEGDPDCGMMKCFLTYVAPGSSQHYVIMESNYRDEDAYWIHGVSVGKGKAAEDHMDDCRWLERARVALITDARSIYVTQTEAGGFEYQSYNHNGTGAEPSTVVKNGKHQLNRARGVESFTFTSGEFTYVVNVGASEKRPFAEVLVKKNGATIQKEHCLVYSYSRKSS